MNSSAAQGYFLCAIHEMTVWHPVRSPPLAPIFFKLKTRIKPTALLGKEAAHHLNVADKLPSSPPSPFAFAPTRLKLLRRSWVADYMPLSIGPGMPDVNWGYY
ncbi:hypothetical protein BB8028_0001g11200 [Beauveria bassiana]|uniref:Uncharacterized protein n=1 Tax=Beauveria bassiana TaxID=176275 RepID=A0A2S7XZ11_BEABA|nr:hypothetical protein BB8028_0001g11200 [Beauveria bassiana]